MINVEVTVKKKNIDLENAVHELSTNSTGKIFATVDGGDGEQTHRTLLYKFPDIPTACFFMGKVLELGVDVSAKYPVNVP